MQAFWTISLLLVSNVFMTFAWYGHLRFRSAPIWEVILISWLIAFLEYCFMVPANRMGSYEFSAAQLKIIQEAITLIVFGFFSVLYLKQQLQWNHLVAFGFIFAAVLLVFQGNSEVRPVKALNEKQNEASVTSRKLVPEKNQVVMQ